MEAVTQLTRVEWELIIESLAYTKQRLEDYRYESQDFKREQIAAVVAVIGKARAMRKVTA
jgi:hypothetical protein